MKMLLRSVLFCFMALLSASVTAQVVKFERVYGGTGYDNGYSITQTFDHGYAVVGSTTSMGNGSTDAYLLRIDSMGVVEWQKTFGWTNIDQAYSIRETTDSGLVISGFTNSYGHGGYDMYLIKTDKNGDTLWTRTYGGANWDFAYSIQQTSDGGYVLAGGTYSFGNGGEDMYLVRLDSSGDTLWTKTYGSGNDEEAKSVKQTYDGGFILTGYTKSFGDVDGDVYVVKTNMSGDTLWTKTFDCNGGTDEAFSINQTADSGYIISGVSKNIAGTYNEALLIRTDSLGDTTFTRRYGAPNDAAAYDATQTLDGGYIWVGKLKLSGHYDVYLYKIDAGGWFTFAHTLGGLTGDDEGRCIKQTSDGGYVVAGNSNSYNNGLGDVYVFKTDNGGISSGSIINNATSIVEYASEPTNKHIEIYPNPAEHEALLSFNSAFRNKKYELKIFNSVGQLIVQKEVDVFLSFNGKCQTELSFDEIHNGIYFIQLSSSEETFSSKLVIEQH